MAVMPSASEFDAGGVAAIGEGLRSDSDDIPGNSSHVARPRNYFPHDYPG
jgi:hypothetical protein